MWPKGFFFSKLMSPNSTIVYLVTQTFGTPTSPCITGPTYAAFNLVVFYLDPACISH